MQHFLISAGYAALILFGVLEAACIPVSSEVTFGFAGVLAGQGKLNLALVIVLGTLAEMVGSYVSYYVGRKGGRPLVDRLGRYVLITRSDVDRAERFMTGRGIWAVPVGRMLPFVRAFTSIVAGLVDIPPARFGVLSLIGTAIYATVLSVIGYSVAGTWNTISNSMSVAGYILAAILVVAIVGFVVYRFREFRKEQQNNPAASSPESPESPESRPTGGRHRS
jgi:membrane protein DedA with SNARE-associated domain